MNASNFYKGKLSEDRKSNEWLIGNFERTDFKRNDVRKTPLLELKYWKIRKGEENNHKTKLQKTSGEITIILKGKVKGFVGNTDIVLWENEYIYIPPGVPSNLIVEIQTDTIQGLTIKSPSDPKDKIEIPHVTETKS